MTLRTIESEFTELLLKEQKEELSFDLTLEGPILSRLHPKIIWARLQFQHNPEQEPIVPVIPGWNYDCFINLEHAQRSYPQIKMNFVGKPWSIFKFLQGNVEEAIVEFDELGAVVLSKKELTPSVEKKLHWHVLPQWLNYALSPELWGSQGKWTRFHSRLHQLLNERDLLIGEDLPGYYSIKLDSTVLEKQGFISTNLEKTSLLVLPWSFSLSALEKLEKIIQQEL